MMRKIEDGIVLCFARSGDMQAVHFSEMSRYFAYAHGSRAHAFDGQLP